MSKKESEFDRYERMRKMEREAEAQKRKAFGGARKKAGRPRAEMGNLSLKSRGKNFAFSYEEDYGEYS